MKQLTFILMLGILLSACGMQKEVLTVSANRVNCTGVAPQKCLKIKSKKDKDWLFYYSNIEGLEWEPGYEYVLEVDRIALKDVPADASSEKIVVTKLVDKKYVGQELKLDREYLVTSLNGIPVTTPQGGREAFIKFENGQIMGNGGCNGFFASYEIDKNVIKAGPIGSTMMYCSEEIMKVENGLTKIIEKPVTLEQIGDEIIVWQNNEQVISLKER